MKVESERKNDLERHICMQLQNDLLLRYIISLTRAETSDIFIYILLKMNRRIYFKTRYVSDIKIIVFLSF